jgi:hypothetical protein
MRGSLIPYISVDPFNKIVGFTTPNWNMLNKPRK